MISLWRDWTVFETGALFIVGDVTVTATRLSNTSQIRGDQRPIRMKESNPLVENAQSANKWWGKNAPVLRGDAGKSRVVRMSRAAQKLRSSRNQYGAHACACPREPKPRFVRREKPNFSFSHCTSSILVSPIMLVLIKISSVVSFCSSFCT